MNNEKISIQQLLEAGVHFGHKTNQWNPKMLPYIYTEKNKTHILDLVQSVKFLKEANFYCTEAAKKNKTFIFIGTKIQASKIIEKEAKKCNSFYINERWLGGMLTNWVTLKKRINYLKVLEAEENNKNFDLLPKKETALKLKTLEKLRRNLEGVKTMTKLPDIAIIIDSIYENTALKECRRLKIPVISIIDTNCDPDTINIPIPGNDDSIKSIKIILESLSDSICQGQN